MEEPLYRVVFDGTLSGDFDAETTRRKFAKSFGLDERRVNMLFSGKKYIIKNNVPEKVAIEFLIRLTEIGCQSYIQEILVQENPGVPEHDRRNRLERRLRFRRGPRPGAFLPDRRLTIRRKGDRRQVLDLKKRQQAVPLAFLAYAEDAVNY